MTRLFTGRRLVLAIALVTAALMAGGPVAADTPIGHTGHPGRHHLVDTMASAGVVCTYHPASQLLYKITVRPPLVYARNTTSGTDHQKVGWRYRIQAWDEGPGAWVAYKAGPIKTATASDHVPAAFTSMSGTEEYSAFAGRFRVFVTMLWYRHGAVEARATSMVDYYSWRLGSAAHTYGPDWACGAQYD